MVIAAALKGLSKVSSFEKLKTLERNSGEIWGDMFSHDMREATAMRVKLRSFTRKLTGRGGTVYRGLWVTPQELSNIAKNGFKTDESHYSNHIYFSTNPSESVRFGAQGAGAVDSEKPRGVLVLIGTDPKKGGIKRRPLPDGKGKTEHSIAIDDVPGEAVNGVWVFDPTFSESAPMRSVDLRALRSE